MRLAAVIAVAGMLCLGCQRKASVVAVAYHPDASETEVAVDYVSSACCRFGPDGCCAWPLGGSECSDPIGVVGNEGCEDLFTQTIIVSQASKFSLDFPRAVEFFTRQVGARKPFFKLRMNADGYVDPSEMARECKAFLRKSRVAHSKKKVVRP